MTSRGHLKQIAFTILEVLTVMAILVILAAILFPVFARAKRAAKRTVAEANIRSCLQGAVLYGQENDDVLPPLRVARERWEGIAVDPRATWPKEYSNHIRTPLVGSFCYLGGMSEIKGETKPRTLNDNHGFSMMLFSSVFEGEKNPPPFLGPFCGDSMECRDIDAALSGFSDTHVRTVRLAKNRLFGWDGVLLDSELSID